MTKRCSSETVRWRACQRRSSTRASGLSSRSWTRSACMRRHASFQGMRADQYQNLRPSRRQRRPAVRTINNRTSGQAIQGPDIRIRPRLRRHYLPGRCIRSHDEAPAGQCAGWIQRYRLCLWRHRLRKDTYYHVCSCTPLVTHRRTNMPPVEHHSSRA